MIVANQRIGMWAAVATLLSLLACYGTLAAVALLGILGITLTVNTSVWAGVIIVFAWLAWLAVLAGWRRHHSRLAILLTTTGSALLSFTLLITYSHIIELAGFVLLCAGTLLAWWAGRRCPVSPRG